MSTQFLIIGQHLARSTRGRPCAPPAQGWAPLPWRAPARLL